MVGPGQAEAEAGDRSARTDEADRRERHADRGDDACGQAVGQVAAEDRSDGQRHEEPQLMHAPSSRTDEDHGGWKFDQ